MALLIDFLFSEDMNYKWKSVEWKQFSRGFVKCDMFEFCDFVRILKLGSSGGLFKGF